MEHDFLVRPPHLNQAFEPEGSSGGAWGNGITRRSFIKRTGGATVASLVAWNLANQRVTAASPGEASGKKSEVEVYIQGCDLGIDKEGFRQECQTTDTNGAYQWKYGAPGQTQNATLPHDSETPDGTLPLYLTIVATVSDPAKAHLVSFSVGGDEPSCLTITEKTLENGCWKIKIRALQASTPKPGTKDRRPKGTQILAYYKNKVAGGGKFYVLKPNKINKDPVQIVKQVNISRTVRTYHAEYEGQPVYPSLAQHQNPPDTINAPPMYRLDGAINILDQYDKPLAGFYGQTSVKESLKQGPTTWSSFIWIAWMGNGSYVDPMGISQAQNDETQIKLKIAGWELTNNANREMVFDIHLDPPSYDMTINHKE